MRRVSAAALLAALGRGQGVAEIGDGHPRVVGIGDLAKTRQHLLPHRRAVRPTVALLEGAPAFGHATGDLLIRAVAGALESSRRQLDTAARLGGDEFAVVMPGSDLEGAHRFAARVSEVLHDRSVNGPTGPISVQVSAGAATLGPDDTLDALLERADQALYARKRQRSRSNL